jgi:tRNA pseudouridine38-40 synthase
LGVGWKEKGNHARTQFVQQSKANNLAFNSFLLLLLFLIMRYVLEVMYDGTQFHGSQVQGDLPTVQLAINNTLSMLFRKPIASFGASRTDEGVHALSNYYHFDIDAELDFDLFYKGNAILPEGVAIKTIYKAVKDDFNCRFDAVKRHYRYRIYSNKNPFLLNKALHYPFRVDRNTLDKTAAVIKEYDHFESFSKRKAETKTFLCTIMHSEWEDHGEELHYVVVANRFLRGMVRGLVGTQLHLARKKKTTDDLRSIIESHDCTKAYFDVAGHGLYLEKIEYPKGALEIIR